MATKKQTNKTSVTETPKASVSAPKKTTAAKAAAEIKPVAEKQAAKVPAKTTAKTAKAVKTAKITFTLPKEAVENAETVAVVGDFCNWDVTKAIALKKQKDGSFQTAVELESGRSYQFRFLIDGAKWENAWNADEYEMTPFGVYNSVVKA